MPKLPDNRDILKAFGKRLRFLRNIENLTQCELAEKAGVSFEHVNKLERGASGPSFAVVCSLAEALDTQPASLFLFSLPEQNEEPADVTADKQQKPDPDELQHLDWTRFITHVGFWRADLATGAVHWSSGLFKMLGYKPREFTPDANSIFDHVADEDATACQENWKRLQQGQTPNNHGIRFLRKDGEQRHGLLHADLERDDSGEPVVARGLMLDLTELKRLEVYLLQNQAKLEALVRLRTAHRDQVIQELEHKNEETRLKAEALEEALKNYEQTASRYEMLFNEAPVGFVCLDVAGRVLEANTAACDLLGCEEPNIIAMDLAQKLVMDQQQFDRRLQRVIYLDQRLSFETLTPKNAACGERHLLFRLGPLLMDDQSKVCLAAITDISERKWAEQALKEVSEHYRIMVEESGDAVCIVTNNEELDRLEIVYANNLFMQLFQLPGKQNARISLETALQVVHPDYRDLLRSRALQRLNDENPPRRYEFRMDSPQETWLEVYAGRIEINGTPAILGGLRDITQRKLAENMLLRSEARLDAIYNAIPMAIGIWRHEDGDFVLAGINKFCETFSPQVRSFIDAKASDFYADNPDVLQALHACHDRGEQVRKTCCYVFHHDGSKAYLRFTLTPLQPDQILLLAEDVSCQQQEHSRLDLERRRLEALYQLTFMQERPLREIMEYALEQAVALTDSKYGYIYLMNAKQEQLQLFAWSSQARKDCTIKNIKPHFLVHETGLWGEAIRQSAPVITNDYASSPFRKGIPEGHVPLTQHCNIPVQRAGRIVAVLGVANKSEDYGDTDIRIMELLMERVLGLWQDKIAQGRLRSAKRIAERANTNKSKHLSDMSHEIRTPLNGLMGILQLLDHTSLDQEQRDYLALARDAGASLMGIINDVLDFSRIESGRMELRPEPCDPARLLQRTAAMYEEQVRKKGLELQLKTSADLPVSLLLDPIRFEQIVANLLGNAVKFTNKGRISVSLDLAQGNPGPELCLQVKDTGCGISPQLQKRLFQPFTREDQIGEKIPGTGLGLSIVRRLAECMGGSVSCESVPDLGSVFTCRLPAEPAAAEQVAGLDKEDDVSAGPTPSSLCETTSAYGNLRVLVVDDDALSLRVLQELLRRHGHEAHCASHGREALALADKEAYDLIFMDVQMPVMDGLEALQRLRAGQCQACPSDVPVVALTACALKGDKEELLAQGMDGYLAKPIEVDDVLEAVRQYGRRTG